MSNFGSYDGSGRTLIGVPSNLIKHFNIHETLQPIKTYTNTTTDPSNDTLLINFDDSVSCRPETRLSRYSNNNTENKNNEFNIIDAFQNIYVNPEQISKNWEPDIDYDEFCRKQSGTTKKYLKTTDSYLDQRKRKSFDNQIDFECTLDKVVEGKFGKTNKNIHLNNEHVENSNALDHEDLIEELLSQENNNKKKITNVTISEDPHNVKILQTPLFLIDDIAFNNTYSPNKDYLEIHQNITSNGEKKGIILTSAESFHHEKLVNGVSNHKIPCNAKLNDSMVLKFLKTMECKDIKLKTTRSSHYAPPTPDIMNSDSKVSTSIHKKAKDNNEHALTNLKQIVKRNTLNNSLSHFDIFSLLSETINPERMMITLPIRSVLKDNKMKANIDINGVAKINYTKGPDLHEKSIVLPQILGRLSLQKKALDEKRNNKRRLRLDAGTGYITSDDGNKNSGMMCENITLDPTVLMEDCNMERKRAFKTRQMIDNFVRSGSPSGGQ